MLIPFSMISVLATTTPAAQENKECTVSTENIAGEASIAYSGNFFWALEGSLLVDGNKENQAHSPSSPNFSWITKFGKAYEITNIDVYVNGTGNCPRCGRTHEIELQDEGEPGLVKSIQLILRDDLGNEVYKSDVISFVEYDGDGKLIDFSTEYKFKFAKLSVATAEFVVKSNSWGGAIFNEIEIYKEVGEHNWVLDEDKTVPSSCTANGKNVFKCECGAKKEETTNQHTVEEWTIIEQPTTTTTGTAEGPCTVPGCGGIGSKALPRLMLSDNEFSLNLNNLKVTEDVKEWPVPDDATADNLPYSSRNKDSLFDGFIETVTWHPVDTIWCGTAFNYPYEEVAIDDPILIGKYTSDEFKGMVFDDKEQKEVEKVIVAKNTLITAEVIETLKGLSVAKLNVYEPYHSTLTVTFDQVYTLTTAELFVYSNWCHFAIEFLGADGTVLKSIDKASFQNDRYQRLIFTGEVYGMDIKSIVITVKGAKWEGGSGLAFTEMKLGAHECEFKPEDIAAGSKDGCVTTFNGKCIICQKNRVDAKVTEHTFEKDEQDPTKDKIVETITEVSCYRNGIVKKHCTGCNQDIEVVIDATGDHVFDYDNPVYVKEMQTDESGNEVEVELKPDCGTPGMGYEKCKTEGCAATTAPHVIPPQGEHSYDWLEKEETMADYTHEGTEFSTCTVCGHIDESAGTQASKKLTANILSAQDWTIRYTDFVSPRATFTINMKTVQNVEDAGFDVKIYGIAQKGETVKEIQVYGEGTTTGYYAKSGTKGTFSLVVKNAALGDEFKFSAKVVISSADGATAETVTSTKTMTGNSDGTVCTYDIAKYYISSENRASKLEAKYGASVKNFYADIASKAPAND